jgi:hypothetical protein
MRGFVYLSRAAFPRYSAEFIVVHECLGQIRNSLKRPKTTDSCRQYIGNVVRLYPKCNVVLVLQFQEYVSNYTLIVFSCAHHYFVKAKARHDTLFTNKWRTPCSSEPVSIYSMRCRSVITTKRRTPKSSIRTQKLLSLNSFFSERNHRFASFGTRCWRWYLYRRGRKWQEKWENCAFKSFGISVPHQIICGRSNQGGWNGPVIEVSSF